MAKGNVFSNMKSQNAILALGAIGIALRDEEKGPDLIFPIFLVGFSRHTSGLTRTF